MRPGFASAKREPPGHSGFNNSGQSGEHVPRFRLSCTTLSKKLSSNGWSVLKAQFQTRAAWVCTWANCALRLRTEQRLLHGAAQGQDGKGRQSGLSIRLWKFHSEGQGKAGGSGCYFMSIHCLFCCSSLLLSAGSL